MRSMKVSNISNSFRHDEDPQKGGVPSFCPASLVKFMPTCKSKGNLKSQRNNETGQKEKCQGAAGVLPGMQILTWIFPSFLHAPEIEVQSVHLRGKPLPEDDSEISRLLKWQEFQKNSQAFHPSTDLQRSSTCSPKD